MINKNRNYLDKKYFPAIYWYILNVLLNQPYPQVKCFQTSVSNTKKHCYVIVQQLHSNKLQYWILKKINKNAAKANTNKFAF